MPVFKLATVSCGNKSVSRTFISARKTFIKRIFKLATECQSKDYQLDQVQPQEVDDNSEKPFKKQTVKSCKAYFPSSL